MTNGMMVMMMIGDFLKITIGSIIGGETIRQIGNVSEIPKGIRDSSQTFVGAGVLGMAASGIKRWLK